MLTGVRAENFLLDHGYIELNTRSVYYKLSIENDKSPRLLTSQQKDFLINNLPNANNAAQLKDMKKLLDRNDELQSMSILSFVEEKYLSS